MNKISIGFTCLILVACQSAQKADNSFDVSVPSPAFISGTTKVVIDQGHHNMHTMQGTYKPFARLAQNDGLKIYAGTYPVTPGYLDSIDIYIVANAKGGDHDFKYKPAFAPAECSLIADWVQGGGSLLLIADHYPFGASAASVAEIFGVHMFGGETTDTVNSVGSVHDRLIFSGNNGLLMDHPITRNIKIVVSDRGQSLSAPSSAQVLLKLSDTSQHSIPDSVWTVGATTYTNFADPVSAAGNCQGLAMEYGNGRIVMLGEAAMITAQIFEGKKFGMNTEGNDNKQFALNILRWLGRKY